MIIVQLRPQKSKPKQKRRKKKRKLQQRNRKTKSFVVFSILEWYFQLKKNYWWKREKLSGVFKYVFLGEMIIEELFRCDRHRFS